jgi:hypothetical protein
MVGREKEETKVMVTIAERHGVEVRELDQDEGKALLDKAARRFLKMSGDDFRLAWNAGKFDDDPDRPEVMSVVMLLPFAD